MIYFAEFIFVIDHVMVNFAEFNFAKWGQNRKNKFRKNFFRKNFFPQKFLPLRYMVFHINELENPLFYHLGQSLVPKSNLVTIYKIFSDLGLGLLVCYSTMIRASKNA